MAMEGSIEGLREERTTVVAPGPGGGVATAPLVGEGESPPPAVRLSRSSLLAGWIEGLQPFLRNRKAVFGALILIGFFAVAWLAPVISPGDPNDIIARRHEAPSSEHWFGTSGAGQDVFDQTVWGARQTLWVGISVGVLTTLIGIVMGLTAGYFRGPVDDILSLVMNIFLIIPTLPLLIVLSAFLGSSSTNYMIFVLTITGWAWGARVLRAQTLSLREKDFVAAAEVTGESRLRIIFTEIMPNMISLIFAGLFGATIFAIGASSALEFLGLGNPSAVSWGTNLYWAGNNGALITGAWWTVLPAGLCIALVAFSFAMINYAVDEVTNPRLRSQSLATRALKKAGTRVRAGVRGTPVVRHAG
jgi:peptide/nickel transport system permease protein